MSHEFNLDAVIDDSANKSGEYVLWLMVILDAVTNYLTHHSALAESFIFDPDNQFFDFVADEMGYEPEALRERIRKAVRRGRCQKITA